MYRSGTKRFYKNTRVEPVDNGYAVKLDGKPLKTPAGHFLQSAHERLVSEISKEWAAQQDVIEPETMPLTTLACTMIDRIGYERDAITIQLLRYAETDLLCYRTQDPPELAALQNEHWQPLLDWAAETYRIQFQITEDVLPVPQPQDALDSLSQAVESLGDDALTVLAVVTPMTGSIIIGLALVSDRVSPEEAFAAAELDESFQNEKWGVVKEAADRRQTLKRELMAAARFLQYVR